MRFAITPVLRCGLALVLATLSSLASHVAPAAAATPLHVVATTTQVEDWVGQVGGDRITLLPILAGDDDPHDYQPTADDARKFAQADLVFANGVGLETWLGPLLSNVETQHRSSGWAISPAFHFCRARAKRQTLATRTCGRIRPMPRRWSRLSATR